jgi:hypothetical protein
MYQALATFLSELNMSTMNTAESTTTVEQSTKFFILA